MNFITGGDLCPRCGHTEASILWYEQENGNTIGCYAVCMSCEHRFTVFF